MKRKATILLVPLLALAGLFLFASKPTKPAVATKTNSKKYIYLTFDDGPLNGSQNIDSVILAEKIKISVFLVGKHVLANRKMDDYFKYYEENPYIDEYNHSFSHAKNHYEQFYSHTDSAVSDILHNNALLKFPNKIVRLPGRNMWRINGHKRNDVLSGSQTADKLYNLGYKVVGWDLEWQHNDKDGTPKQSLNEMYNEIMTALKNGKTFYPNNIVVLLHDEMFQQKWEESDLKQLIDKLRADNKVVFEQMRFYPQ